MPLQVIERGPGSENLGSAFGKGLGSGLAALGEMKLQDLMAQKQFQRQQQQAAQLRQQESQALQQLGLPEALASSVSALPEKLKGNILSNLGSLVVNIEGVEPGTNIFQSPEQKAEARKAQESAAKTELSKARTGQIARQSENDRLFKQYNEQQAKLKNELTQAKTDTEKQKKQNLIDQLENKKNVLGTQNLAQEEKAERLRQSKQKSIDAKLKPYNTLLEKNYRSAENVANKAAAIIDLIENGNVLNNISNKYSAWYNSNTDTQLFEGYADDIANALTEMSAGSQGIQRVKFNRERKPTVYLTKEAQLGRANEVLKEANKVVLEEDLRNYFVNQNNGENPNDLKEKIRDAAKKVGETPLKSKTDQEGQIFRDKKTGATWIVNGPLLRFNGFM
jgi:hypothetical protein